MIPDDPVEAASKVMLLRLRDQEYKIAVGNIPIRIKAKFMDQTGRSVEWYFAEERFGELTMCALWFLVRLLELEAVTWNDALDEWAAAGYTLDEFALTEDDGKGDDPEV